MVRARHYGFLVSTSLGSELTELVPLALVVALSPLSIIPAVLVLHSPKARESGLAYLAGWLVGLLALTGIFVGTSSLIGKGSEAPPTWASWARVAVGVALIVFGIYRWITRHTNAHSPKWMKTITETTPGRALVTGAVLTVLNPKVLFICLAAGLAIGTAGLGASDSVFGVLIYVIVAASTVIVPVLAYVVMGAKLDPPLSRLKEWMEKHNASLVAVILVVIGLLVLYKGIHGL